MTALLHADNFSEQHLTHLKNWLADPAVHRNLYTLYRPMNPDELKSWFKREQKDSARIFFYHTIPETHINTAVGMGVVHYIHPKHSCGELSIIVNPACSGRGFGKHILVHLMDCAFKKLHLHKIFFHCAEPNSRMISIAEKAGFIREGVYREEILLDGTWHDTYRYGMLESEHASLNKKVPSAHTITT